MTIAFPTRASTLSASADALIKSADTAKLNWINVDTSTLPPDLAKAYSTYKAAQDLAVQARTAFEDMACGPIGKLMSIRPDHDVAFGYRWGQLSVAAAPKRTSTSKSNALRF